MRSSPPRAGRRVKQRVPHACDAELATELLNDPKEIAEHVMLIDLARNDVGRISQIGSVVVTDQMVIEKYSHVQHIVSSVEGKLKELGIVLSTPPSPVANYVGFVRTGALLFPAE